MGCQRHCQRLRPAVEKVSFYFHLRDANGDNEKPICEDADCDNENGYFNTAKLYLAKT